MAIEPFRELLDKLEFRRSAIDVGANRGDYSLVLAKYFDHVTAFEPDPGTFLRLSEKVRASGFTRITTVNAAVTDHVGDLTFYRDLRPQWDGVAGSVNILDGLDGQTEKITVPAVSLDDYCAQHRLKPDFIKMDVEGHEPAAIAGALQTISRHRPVLMFEFWESWFDRGYKNIFTLLSEWYELTVFESGASVQDRYMATDGKLSQEPTSVDILCLPRQKTPLNFLAGSLRRLTRRLPSVAAR